MEKMNGTDFFCKPRLIKLNYGGWLAVSDSASPLRLGVVGVSEKDAVNKFEVSLKRWREIAEMDVIKYGSEQENQGKTNE